MLKVSRKKFIVVIALTCAIIIGLVMGTHFGFNAVAQPVASGSGGPPEATPVSVVEATSTKTQIWNEFSGRLEASQFAEIRPQVGGTITEIHFESGDMVEEGAILYTIDKRPYQATVNLAKAALKGAKNRKDLAWKELKRAKSLIQSRAIAQRTYDARANEFSLAAAQVEREQAAVQQAQINLNYASIKAPISGRTGRIEIKKGNLVDAGVPVLTSIVDSRVIFADFEVDEASYLAQVKSTKKAGGEAAKTPIEMIAGGNTPYTGYVQSFDNELDIRSGTIRARAVFDNADGALLPGMFVQIRMGSAGEVEHILLTEQAIGTDQDRKFVYVVSPENTVEYRTVTLGESVLGKRVIASGLTGGEQVISKGIIRLRPGMPVKPIMPEPKSEEELKLDAKNALPIAPAKPINVEKETQKEG